MFVKTLSFYLVLTYNKYITIRVWEGGIMAERKKKTYEIGELDQYLFGQGNHYEIYKKLGCAPSNSDGHRQGCVFCCVGTTCEDACPLSENLTNGI